MKPRLLAWTEGLAADAVAAVKRLVPTPLALAKPRISREERRRAVQP